MNKKLWGKEENLYTYLKLENIKYHIYIDPNKDDIFDIETESLDNTINVVLFTSFSKVIKNIDNAIIYSLERVMDFFHITDNYLLNIAIKFFNLNIDDDIKTKLLILSSEEDIYNIVYKYSIVKDRLFDVFIKKEKINTILYVTYMQKRLDTWISKKNDSLFGEYKEEKRKYLENLLYRLNVIFYRTGLNVIDFFYIINTLITNSKR